MNRPVGAIRFIRKEAAGVAYPLVWTGLRENLSVSQIEYRFVKQRAYKIKESAF